MHTFHSPVSHPSIILRWFAPRLDALAYVSEATRDMYESVNGTYHDRVAIVPGGVVAEDCTPAGHSPDRGSMRHRFGLEPDAFIVLFVGRIVREKGAHVAVEALARLREQIPSARLVIAGPPGPGPENERYYAELQGRIRGLGLEKRIHVLGLVDQDALGDLYRASDCLVVPSLWPEPAGMVVVEGMKEGLPVLAASVGGLASRVTDGATGLLFPAGDSKELAHCIAFLASDPEARLVFGREARRWVAEHASALALARFHAQMYQGLWREARKP
jgi:1,4-alpha-glucan branching enzyme